MHRPVLAKEVIEFLSVKRGGVYIDGTLGSGGHAELILRRVGPEGRLIGIDRDEEALRRASAKLERWRGQCIFIHGNFADMVGIAERQNVVGADGVLLDLGVSSEQLEAPERGFSFLRDGPLDMRLDRSQGKTVADLINSLKERELETVIRTFGEERAARRIAKSLVERRKSSPIKTTAELAEIVVGVKRGKRGRIHPATQTFQALRIALNKEMGALQEGLEAGLRVLRDGGKLAVISFHSLEDRLVKTFLREHAGHWESQEAGGRLWCGKKPAMALITRKPVRPSRAEMAANRRSRTAKLRVGEKARTIAQPDGVEL